MKLLESNINKMRLRSPLLTASGTSGHSDEIEVLENFSSIINAIGAFVTKGVTLGSKMGNSGIRIAETPSGILNSIGLQNEGSEFFIYNELPLLQKFDVPVIVNISADTPEQFGELAFYLSSHDKENLISGIEINVSCPNIKEGGVAFGTDPYQVENIVKIVKKNIDDRITVITKLTPNVTDITIPARAAIQGGTDALSMINTLRGMAINVETRTPILGNIKGGLSGPAIKPVGVYMVYDCFSRIPECRQREVPIIGIGGISSWQDALEYIMAGASAVGIGTAWFVNPGIFEDIHAGLKKYTEKYNVSIDTLTGAAHAAT